MLGNCPSSGGNEKNIFSLRLIIRAFRDHYFCGYNTSTVPNHNDYENDTHPRIVSSPYFVICLGLSAGLDSSCSSNMGDSVPSDLQK
jgi:hypothetical protein